MQTQKIQITLTPEEVRALSLRGKTLGYNVTKYIKFIITKEAYDTVESFSELQMGAGLAQKTKRSLEEHRKGKSKKLRSLEDLDSHRVEK